MIHLDTVDAFMSGKVLINHHKIKHTMKFTEDEGITDNLQGEKISLSKLSNIWNLLTLYAAYTQDVDHHGSPQYPLACSS